MSLWQEFLAKSNICKQCQSLQSGALNVCTILSEAEFFCQVINTLAYFATMTKKEKGLQY
jgi:hypothetical protein